MCAAQARTSDDAVVIAALAIVRERGPDALSLREVATTVGVKAPSLYKRFDDRRALVAAVETRARAMLRDTLIAAAERGPGGGFEQLGRMARAWRAFARAEPGLDRLVVTGDARHGPNVTEPVRDTLDGLVGPVASPLALQALVSFLHGFADLEAGRAFRLDSAPDASFALGLSALFDGLVLDAASSAGQSTRT